MPLTEASMGPGGFKGLGYLLVTELREIGLIGIPSVMNPFFEKFVEIEIVLDQKTHCA